MGAYGGNDGGYTIRYFLEVIAIWFYHVCVARCRIEFSVKKAIQTRLAHSHCFRERGIRRVTFCIE